jgi:hypothetical protein
VTVSLESPRSEQVAANDTLEYVGDLSESLPVVRLVPCDRRLRTICQRHPMSR